jgi:hypothetical protein
LDEIQNELKSGIKLDNVMKRSDRESRSVWERWRYSIMRLSRDATGIEFPYCIAEELLCYVVSRNCGEFWRKQYLYAFFIVGYVFTLKLWENVFSRELDSVQAAL